MKNLAFRIFFLCLLTFSCLTPCYCITVNTQIKQNNEFEKQASGIAQISWMKQNRPDSTAEEKMAKRLADELNSMGIEIKEGELNAIADAITKGGKGAMALAMMIVTEIAKVKSVPTNNGSSTANETYTKLPEKYLDDILRNCKTKKNAKLALSQFLVPKLVLQKEKNL